MKLLKTAQTTLIKAMMQKVSVDSATPDEPEEVERLIQSSSPEAARELIYELIHRLPSYWQNEDMRGRTQRAIVRSIQSSIAAGRTSKNFLILFRLYLPQQFLSWIKSQDYKTMSFERLNELCETTTWPPSSYHPPDETEYNKNDAQEALIPIYAAMLAKTYERQPSPGRRPRVPQKQLETSRFDPLSSSHSVHYGPKPPNGKLILQNYGKFFLVNEKEIMEVILLTRSLRNARTQAENNAKVTHYLDYELPKYFGMSNMECAKTLRSTPPRRLSEMLLQSSTTSRSGLSKYLTIGDVLPEGEKEIEDVLDHAISNGRLIWERPD